MKKILAVGLLLFASSIGINLHTSLPVGTDVYTGMGPIKIEKLHPGDEILGYDQKTNSYPIVLISEIEALGTQNLVKISTPFGHIYATPKQEFYDNSQKAFVAAENLTTTSVLVSLNAFALAPCTAVEVLEIPALCYKLTLPNPRLFFSTQLNVLTRQFPDHA